MAKKLFTNSECDNVFAVLNKLQKRYKTKYAHTHPGHTIVVSFIFHANAMHVLIDRKLKETLSVSTLKSLLRHI